MSSKRVLSGCVRLGAALLRKPNSCPSWAPKPQLSFTSSPACQPARKCPLPSVCSGSVLLDLHVREALEEKGKPGQASASPAVGHKGGALVLTPVVLHLGSGAAVGPRPWGAMEDDRSPGAAEEGDQNEGRWGQPQGPQLWPQGEQLQRTEKMGGKQGWGPRVRFSKIRHRGAKGTRRTVCSAARVAERFIFSAWKRPEYVYIRV